MVVSVNEGLTFIGLMVAVIALTIKTITNNSSQRQKLYQRMEDVVKEAEAIYVRKNVCEMQHMYIKETLDEIKVFMQDVRKVLVEIKQNGTNR